MNEQQKQLLLSRLKGMEADDLTAIVATLDQLAERQLIPQDIFPEGIIVRDSARARFILTPEKHKELMEIITANPNNPIYKDLTVFPLGIITSDLYETSIQLGRKGS